jgi:hypothetical protein
MKGRNMQLPFGKHAGQDVATVPTPYLSWLASGAVKLSAGLRAAVRGELQRRGVALPDEPPPAPRQCLRCGGTEMRLSWHQCGGKGKARQIRSECRGCRRFCGFVGQTPAKVAEADGNAAPAPLLDVMALAESLGVKLVNVEGRYVRMEPWERVTPDLRTLVRQTQHLLLAMLPAQKVETTS